MYLLNFFLYTRNREKNGQRKPAPLAPSTIPTPLPASLPPPPRAFAAASVPATSLPPAPPTSLPPATGLPPPDAGRLLPRADRIHPNHRPRPSTARRQHPWCRRLLPLPPPHAACRISPLSASAAQATNLASPPLRHPAHTYVVLDVYTSQLDVPRSRVPYDARGWL